MPVVPEEYERAIKVVQDERAYQRRRWGVRQSDGTFVDRGRDLDDYLIPIQHYVTRATAESTMRPGGTAALISVRKIAALAAAILEDGFKWSEMDVWRECRDLVANNPPAPSLPVNAFLMMAAREMAKLSVRTKRHRDQPFMVVMGGLSCLSEFGTPPRDLDREVINYEDDKPA